MALSALKMLPITAGAGLAGYGAVRALGGDVPWSTTGRIDHAGERGFVAFAGLTGAGIGAAGGFLGASGANVPTGGQATRLALAGAAVIGAAGIGAGIAAMMHGPFGAATG